MECPENLYELSKVPNYLGDELTIVDCNTFNSLDAFKIVKSTKWSDNKNDRQQCSQRGMCDWT